jgi:ribosomal protein L24
VGGKNYKSIHDTLKQRERLRLGSTILVTSGTHEGLEGKVVAIVESAKKRQDRVMGDD